MTSTAMQSQDTYLEIESGTGGAKNITGITPGNPTIITIAAHGYNNGVAVALAGITGSIAAALNGKQLAATNVTTNTFAVQVDTTGLAYTNSGTATPAAYTEISNLTKFNGYDGTASEIDVTNLRSTAKESRPGLQDSGKLSWDIHPDFDPVTGVGQNLARAAQASQAIKNFRHVLSDGTVASFAAYVKSMPWQGGVDAVISGTLDLRITGPVTIA